MNKQLQYILMAIAIGIPLAFVLNNIPSLLNDRMALMMAIGLLSAGMIVLIAELYIISQHLYAKLQKKNIAAND